MDNSTWTCSKCGRSGNTGHFCGGCGSPSPVKLAESILGSSLEKNSKKFIDDYKPDFNNDGWGDIPEDRKHIIKDNINLNLGWTCPNCGKEGNIGNFCGNCATSRFGKKIDDVPLEIDGWTCPNCGREGNLGNFCGNCGTQRTADHKITKDGQIKIIDGKVYTFNAGALKAIIGSLDNSKERLSGILNSISSHCKSMSGAVSSEDSGLSGTLNSFSELCNSCNSTIDSLLSNLSNDINVYISKTIASERAGISGLGEVDASLADITSTLSGIE